jgi:transaldolase/glucose-6-phosphate isomerase
MNPLGWKRAPELSLAEWEGHVALAAAARADGLVHTLVCGMGGSSLAPYVLDACASRGPSRLHVLDSTNPAAVREVERLLDVDRTLFVVASKSGTTVETLAFYRYFAARARPDQFVAITDPGTPLEALARARRLRALVRHPPDVGGRYAALTAVGMLPAALLGIDGRTMLERARRIDQSRAEQLGREIASQALKGRDKLLLEPPASIAAIGIWIEQLVAESSGKNGLGVVPVLASPPAPLTDVQSIPGTQFSADPLDLGAEFLRWEYATAALCDRLGVNAFDQPDVEEAKRLARVELEGTRAKQPMPVASLDPAELRRARKPGDYIAILAYLPPRPDVTRRLEQLRDAWSRSLGCVATLGIGPRYLHSTGQLHKGGANNGLFLVVTADHDADMEIPGMDRTFGELHHAQARGDIRALLARGRRVAHVHLSRIAELDQLEP